MATNNAINKKSASITFDGTNVLSDYVTATTWTPDLQFGGAKVGITYTTQAGKYTRIGNIIFYTGIITLSSKGSSNGDVRIYGLPVTSTEYSWGNNIGYSVVTFTGDSLQAQVQQSTTYLVVFRCSKA